MRSWLRFCASSGLFLSLHEWNCIFSVDAIGGNWVNDLFSSENEMEPIPEDIMVGVYYYPWYAGDFHRGQTFLREILSPQHQPALGKYDDRSSAVISQHLAWSRQANVNLWLCSWWGPNSREDSTISDAILNNSDLGDHKIALFYETTGRIPKSQGYPIDKVRGDIEHICKTYFGIENYYRINGKPVLGIYITRALARQPPSNDQSATSLLEEVVRIMRETAWSECGSEIYIIGDQVWKSAPAIGSDYDPFNHLDAVTNFDVYGNMNNPPYAGIQRVNEFYLEQMEWKTAANLQGVSYIPAVSPGYNDRAIRLDRNKVALSRRLENRIDTEGSLFVAELQRARYLVDDGADRLLLVNSFNEWHEDTQIEPCNGPPTIAPLGYTNGIRYEGYGDLYLNILRVATTPGGGGGTDGGILRCILDSISAEY